MRVGSRLYRNRVNYIAYRSIIGKKITVVKLSALDRRDRQIAFLLGAVALATYLRTLAPGLLPGDSGEFQVAAWQLGLAHATGYPLYLLLGSGWQHGWALVGAEPAWALNAWSALAAAVGVSLLYWVMTRELPDPPLRRRTAALYSALLLALNLTYWSQSLIAEVYALHVVLMLAVLAVAQRLITRARGRTLVLLALLAGLSLTHHALSLLWLPAVGLYLLMAGVAWRQLPRWSWPVALLAGLLPLLLYLYIPLRSGPLASPWYHQPLGNAPLTLYGGGWESFRSFITGASIGAGFRSPGEALAQLPTAAWLWRYHFGWIGLVMIAAGLVWLVSTRRWAWLTFTLLYVLVQQTFNLFYAIDDILVYYIPLYLVGAMWAGCGLAGLASTHWRAQSSDAPAQPAGVLGWVAAGVLILLTLRSAPITAAQIDQSSATAARTQWESILAAAPGSRAILVSNDRNEIVPLFYLQSVEGRGQGLTGLFPGIAPDARFGDIGATLATALEAALEAALAAAQDAEESMPVYLIKPMPGLEVAFELAPVTPPLVQVIGQIEPAPPSVVVDQAIGPLRLLGYDPMPNAQGLELRLHWQVIEPVGGDYTLSLQILGEGDTKLAQEDLQPGGVYYPSSLWQPGATLVTHHHLDTNGPLSTQATLLVTFYMPADMTQLAPPLRLPLP
jgi:hypothetical protein